MTGGVDERVNRFLLAKELGRSEAELDSMPWWRERAYVEVFEMIAASRSDPARSGALSRPQTRTAPKASPPQPMPDIAEVADVLGVTVVRGG